MHTFSTCLTKRCGQAGEMAPLQEFGALFDGVKFRKGLQLNFTSSKDGALITQVDNKQVVCSVKSLHLK